MAEHDEFEKDIVDLRRHIEQLFGDSEQPDDPNGFDTEFNHIDRKTAHDSFFGNYQSALMLCNRSKNRYSNVLPLEDTRVKLEPIEGVEGSDYINANYVNGEVPGSQKTYVTTQGPLQNTVGDFWRMVWQTKADVVVMLTKELENGRVKCHRYWPETGSILFDQFKITNNGTEKTSELIKRHFSLEDTIKKQCRNVIHLQYVGWPDHGLPASIVGFLELLRLVDQFNTGVGPIIVHCSAGIGRSGTFCAVHSTLHKLKRHLQTNPDKSPTFNLVKTVLKLREQRTGMVQTKEQYMFCYLAILEEATNIIKKFQQDKEKERAARENKDTLQGTNACAKPTASNSTTPSTAATPLTASLTTITSSESAASPSSPTDKKQQPPTSLYASINGLHHPHQPHPHQPHPHQPQHQPHNTHPSRSAPTPHKPNTFHKK